MCDYITVLQTCTFKQEISTGSIFYAAANTKKEPSE